METKPKTTPKDFFLYVGAMITLYWSAGALIALLFRIIDTIFSDDLGYYVDPYSSGVRFAMASLIVVFPISLYLFRMIKKDVQQDSGKLHFPLRRWFYALTIFATAVTLIIDVIALLNGFLGGDLTTQFFLKVLSVLLVAGLVFWYCLVEIRTLPGSNLTVRQEFLWGAPILVLAAIVAGFAVMGSPSTQRSLRLDSQRTSDLQTIQWQIVNYWQQKGKIPEILSDLEDPISGFKAPLDPKSKDSYEYSPLSATSFELCASFERASVSGKQAVPAPYYAGAGILGSENWTHDSDHVCFKRAIDAELYPVRPKKP